MLARALKKHSATTTLSCSRSRTSPPKTIDEPTRGHAQKRAPLGLSQRGLLILVAEFAVLSYRRSTHRLVFIVVTTEAS